MTTDVRLLMVDDDEDLGELIGDYLENEGFKVELALNADEALLKLKHAERYALMILDVMMPGKSGLELLQELRPAVTLPVIMLTGRGEEIDRILGLEMGADDYLSKPCNPRELLARIRAILRRSENQPKLTLFPNRVVEHMEITLDPGNREVTVKGQAIELTGTEFNVLGYLLANPGQVMSKEQLTELVLHRELTAYDRAMDVHVSRVRQKLAKHLPDRDVIKTIRGAGYMFVQG